MDITNNNFLFKNELNQWAKVYAEKKLVDDEITNQWLVFYLGKEKFALSMDYVDELALLEYGIALYNVRPEIVGMINLRGNAVLLLDMRKIIKTRDDPKKNYKNKKDKKVIILRDSKNQRTGFLVDSIDGIVQLPAGTFNTYSLAENDQQAVYVGSVAEYEGNGISKINVESLLKIIEA